MEELNSQQEDFLLESDREKDSMNYELIEEKYFD